MAVGPIGEQCRSASASLVTGRYGRPVPPDPLVPVVPVPALVPVLEPGREREEVSVIAPVPDRLRDALSFIVPVPVLPVPLVPLGAVPDIEPVAPIDVSVPVELLVPLMPADPAAPAPDVPTSPPLVPAVLSRLLPELQAPTASTAASASTPLPMVALRIGSLPLRGWVMNIAA
jgi:hypothetical protein